VTVNLIDRAPIPGSWGQPVAADVVVHVQTTGTVAQNTITITIDGHPVITAGAFQTGYGGTILTDGSGGWTVTINPVVNFAYGATVTVAVQCVEQPGSVAFSQSYSFQTIRDVEVVGSVRYFVDGDVVEADVYCLDGGTTRASLVDQAVVQLVRDTQVVQTVSIDNRDRQADAGSTFFGRFLHPPEINRDMTWAIRAAIDPYGAPGVGTVTASGPVVWVDAKQRGAIGAQQPSVKPGEMMARVIPAENAVDVQQAQAAQYEVVDLSKTGDASVEPTVLADLDFANTTNYIQALAGDLRHAGGGHRLLVGIDNPDDWFLQEPDDLAVTFGARQLVEPAGTNLLANSDLVQDPLVATAPDPQVRIDREYSELTAGVRQVIYTVEGSVTYDGVDRSITVSSPRAPIATGQPVTASLLCRTVLRDATVTLDTFVLRVRFWNGTTPIGQQDTAFDIRAVESLTDLSLLEAVVLAGDVPGASTHASLDLIVGSFEGCDRVTIVVAAPAIENTGFATSRIVGPTAPLVRLADDLDVPQAGNLNVRTGRVAVQYAPQYSDAPPVQVTLFDTRDPSLLRNGYSLRHRTDGRLELLAVTSLGAVTSLVSTDPVALVAGEPVTITAIWGPGSLAIKRDTLTVATASGPYGQPDQTARPTTMTIGRRADSTEYLLGDLRRFTTYGVAP
jgi:hypothetical protein